ncbi:MAG TPA: trigger factor [Chloroflexota bacterium]|nr:trigger factor [Chloroflexota bacterium]
MQVEVAPQENGSARMSVVVSAEEVESAVNATYQRLSQRVKIPGFRPGKAPRQVVLRTIGEEYFLHQATDEVLRRWYPKALEESGLDPIAQGTLDAGDDHGHVHPGEEFRFAATVPIKPLISLPDYRQIKIPAPPVIVAIADVDDVLDKLRWDRGSWEPAPARAAEAGDAVRVNVTGRIGGHEVAAEEDLQVELVAEEESEEERNRFADDPRFPGLSRKLAGSRVGDIKDLVLQLPQGKGEDHSTPNTMTVTVIVKEVLKRALPPLDDEFARNVSSAEDVQGLRALIRRNLERERAEEARTRVAREIIDSLIARTNPPAPETLVEKEMDSIVRDARRSIEQAGMKFDEFLIIAHKSEEQFRQESRPQAERRVKRDLILESIVEAEGIEVTPEEIEAQVETMSQYVTRSDRDYERLVHSERLHEAVAENLARSKALNLLVEIVSGLKPEEDEDEDADDSIAFEAAEADDDQPAEAATAQSGS